MIDFNLNFMRIQKLVSKRTSKSKVKKGIEFYSNNKELINIVEKI